MFLNSQRCFLFLFIFMPVFVLVSMNIEVKMGTEARPSVFERDDLLVGLLWPRALTAHMLMSGT